MGFRPPRMMKIGLYSLRERLRSSVRLPKATRPRSQVELGNALVCEVALRKRVRNTALWKLGRHAVSVCLGALWIERRS